MKTAFLVALLWVAINPSVDHQDETLPDLDSPDTPYLWSPSTGALKAVVKERYKVKATTFGSGVYRFTGAHSEVSVEAAEDLSILLRPSVEWVAKSMEVYRMTPGEWKRGKKITPVREVEIKAAPLREKGELPKDFMVDNLEKVNEDVYQLTFKEPLEPGEYFVCMIGVYARIYSFAVK